MIIDSRVAACGNPVWLFIMGSTDGGEVHGIVLLDEGVIEGVTHQQVIFSI
jgi:hypothetical protein